MTAYHPPMILNLIAKILAKIWVILPMKMMKKILAPALQ